MVNFFTKPFTKMSVNEAKWQIRFAKHTNNNDATGLLTKGNNPMVGMTVAVAVAIEEAETH